MGTSGVKPACRIDCTYAFHTACADAQGWAVSELSAFEMLP